MRAESILIVDDEVSIRTLMERALRQEGFAPQSAENGEAAFKAIAARSPDLIILDYNLPDISGKDICKRIRRNAATRMIPIIMITGSAIENLPSDCLDSGADDYISKPFDMKEMISRIRAVSRRAHDYVEADKLLRKGLLTIDVAEHRIFWDETPVSHLTPKEFSLLHQIVLYAPRVLDKNTLALKVWGETLESLHERTLDVHIWRIRAKLGPVASKSLLTVPAVGFQWLDESTPA